MQEIINITRFLTRQNVHHNMQNEILSYYQTTKKKYWVLILDYYDNELKYKNKDYIYYELIPYEPIEQINLMNLYKFVFDTNIKFKYSRYGWRMIDYNNDGINFNYKNNKFTWNTKDVLNDLKQGNCVRFGKLVTELDETVVCYLKTMKL